MHIEVTKIALKHLLEQAGENPIIKIAYDIEGCGCAVDGVVQLWKVSGLQEEDQIGYEGEAVLIYDRRQEVFFEDVLQLDYHESKLAFSLKSKNQIYHPSLMILDKTGG